MSDAIITNATVVQEDRLVENCTVCWKNGVIERVGPDEQFAFVDGVKVIDAEGAFLVPGFIDLHIHGVHNVLVDNGPDELERICEILPQYGVTGFLPTVCPLPKGEDAELLSALSKANSAGTAILGFFLEGPFLTITGALSADALGAADPERVQALVDAGAPYKVVFAVSPDFENIGDLLPIMSAGDTPVFVTHTRADVKQTEAAIAGGVRHATHFYDVFYPPEVTDGGVRPCGAVEAILADPRVTVDFILDGEHVDPIAVKMALRCKGPDGVCLITDSNLGAGLPPGRYPGLSGSEVEFAYPGGPARMTENSIHPGALAGSGLTMDRAVRNAIEMLDVGLPQAVRMASANPARVLGLENRKGQNAEGFDADLLLLNKDLEVETTFVAGECRYSK